MVDFFRILGVYGGYGIIIPINSYLFYKILKRKKKNEVSLSLSAHFLLSIFAFVLNLIYILLQVDPIAFILYIMSAFCILFSSFFLTFSLLALYKELKPSKSLSIVLLYIVIIVLILSIPNNIKYDQSTNWRPKYS